MMDREGLEPPKCRNDTAALQAAPFAARVTCPIGRASGWGGTQTPGSVDGHSALYRRLPLSLGHPSRSRSHATKRPSRPVVVALQALGAVKHSSVVRGHSLKPEGRARDSACSSPGAAASCQIQQHQEPRTSGLRLVDVVGRTKHDGRLDSRVPDPCQAPCTFNYRHPIARISARRSTPRPRPRVMTRRRPPARRCRG